MRLVCAGLLIGGSDDGGDLILQLSPSGGRVGRLVRKQQRRPPRMAHAARLSLSSITSTVRLPHSTLRTDEGSGRSGCMARKRNFSTSLAQTTQTVVPSYNSRMINGPSRKCIEARLSMLDDGWPGGMRAL